MSLAQAGNLDLKSLRDQGHAWRVPRREGTQDMCNKKITILYLNTYMYDFVVNLSRFHPFCFLLIVQTIRSAGDIADVGLNPLYIYIYIYIYLYIYVYDPFFSNLNADMMCNV